ncbi:MAG: N-6 DNA methylase [Ignavibacteriaceae bacterium]|nr:N-6 DNA methylase [Ignavibacteriaceae bacterium]
MKLEQHVEGIKNKILSAFTKQLSSEGLKEKDYSGANERLKSLIENLIGETASYEKARLKLLDEFTFTLFNRIAAIKVMEAKTLIPETIIPRANNGDRSFAHKLWLEQNPHKRNLPFEALDEFITAQFRSLANEINLFSEDYLYDKIPNVFDLKEIIDLFNLIEETEWKSDDIMGWLYESYNKTELSEFKESKAKIEYDKVSLSSQVYTPKWVVKFLVDNSLGKLYLEMYPDSALKEKYLIANAPKTRTREPKKPEEIKLIDPAPGSGNFLLYAFDFFFDIYLDQGYDEDDIPKLIIENNLYGIDIDDRAIQICQLGLYIKAKEKNRSIKIEKFNIVSSDFYLPEYDNVKNVFEADQSLDSGSVKLIKNVWEDLRFAYKFGSLLSIEEKFNNQFDKLLKTKDTLFGDVHIEEFSNFRNEFFPRLKSVVAKYSNGKGNKFLKSKTIDSFSFLEIISAKYDVAVANPPYTDSSDFGAELKKFIDANYKTPYKFHSNLYSCFIKKCIDLVDENGKIVMIHPHTFMFIKSFEDIRKYILEKLHINIFVDYGLDRVNLFFPGILVEAV